MTPTSDHSSCPRRGLWWIMFLAVAAAAALYFVRVPDDPPGFAIDESSICYNAHTISETGQDEHGVRWPLFFRAFGEYKNPSFIYLLAAVFRVTGPSIAAARCLSAALGVTAALLLGVLAWQMTRRWLTTFIVTLMSLLTPWLFESSRLVLEIAIYPAVVVLFLLTVWRCSRKLTWHWRDVLTLAVTLALLTYSYSIGRLLGPLLAVGLLFFIKRERASALVRTWAIYVALLLPLWAFHVRHPGALTGRFKALTYLDNGSGLWTTAGQFVLHYLANLNPWRWLAAGENNIRDHVPDTGALLLATVALGLFGLVLVLRQHRSDAWWRFVLYALAVSVVPASLTSNPFPQLRLIAFPILFLVVTIPAVAWVTDERRSKRMLWVATLTLIVLQGLFFQWRYHKEAPKLWYVFDARFPRKVLATALSTGIRPIHLLDEPGKSGYIHALWYGAVAGIPSGSFDVASGVNKVPSGAVVISTEEDCRDCRLLSRALNYIVYTTAPHPDVPAALKAPLTQPRAEIIADRPRSRLSAGESATFDFRIKNIGAAEWPALGNLDGAYAVKLEGRWIQAERVQEGRAEKRLPFDVEPGDTVGLTLEVMAPSDPGDYVLEVDLRQEQAGRFSEHGSKAWHGNVEVAPRN